MAWTTPMTFTVGQILTAAQLNANLSANLNYLRSNATNVVGTSESTASATFVDLATVGPSVTATTDVQAMVIVSAYMTNSGVNYSTMGFAVSGASTIAATDSYAVSLIGTNGGRVGVPFFVTGLTAGSNTFKAVYRSGAGTATFQDRRITVMPS